MEIKLAVITCTLLFTSNLISGIYTDEDALLNKFLGSPLFALTAILVIVAVAFLYRKIRK